MKKETRQNLQPRESSKAESAADQKEHKGLFHFCPKKKLLDDPQDFLEESLWTDETKVQLFRGCVLHYI